MSARGRVESGWLRRALGLGPKQTWHDRHPLPEGWRPRTRIDAHGRQVEPWAWLVTDPHGHAHDGGEWWLPLGRDPDEAAWEILERWLEKSAGYLEPWEIPGLQCSVRHGAYPAARVGVAHAVEQAITGR